MYLQQISPDTGLYDWAVQTFENRFSAEERRDDAEQMKVMSHPITACAQFSTKFPWEWWGIGKRRNLSIWKIFAYRRKNATEATAVKLCNCCRHRTNCLCWK